MGSPRRETVFRPSVPRPYLYGRALSAGHRFRLCLWLQAYRCMPNSMLLTILRKNVDAMAVIHYRVPLTVTVLSLS